MQKKIESINVLYPMPVTIVGTVVDGKVNFVNIAHVGILNAQKPHLISLGIHKSHYSNIGIKANKTFSVNILSKNKIIEMDYVGIVSGKDTDKSSVFEVFYGDDLNAPIIKECPLAMECRLVDIYDIKTHDIFIGEVVSTYAQEEVLSDGKVDIKKVDPLLFDMSSLQYWTLGDAVGGCWKIGKNYVNK